MGWSIVKLGDVCDLQNGFAFKSKDYIDSSNTLNIRMSNIRPDGSFNPDHNIRFLPDSYIQDYPSFLLKEGDLVIAMTDMAGEPKILGLPTLIDNLDGRNFLMNQRVGKLFGFTDDIFVPYLRYYLSSPIIKEYYKSKGAGGLQINISKKDVLSAEIPLPPIPEQKRIVAILDQVFADIEQARAKTEQNLKNARELFESYLQQVFSQSGEDVLEVALSEITKCISDGDHAAPPKSEEGVPFITISNINKSTNVIDFTKTFKVPESYYSALKATRKPILGDVLYTVTGSYGIPVIVTEDKEFCFQRHIGLVRPNNDVDSNWLYYLLMSPQVFKQADNGATGTAQKTVSLKLLRSIRVPKTPLAEQKNTVKLLDFMYQKSKQLENIYAKKLEALDELKKSILQKAFSGELTKTPDKETKTGVAT